MTDELPSDPSPELVSRARAGSQRAFADLVRPYAQRLFAFLMREMGNADDAEDLMQEVLVRAWQGLPQYEHRDRFEGWLFTIAYRQLAGHRRRSRRRDRTHDTLRLHASPPAAASNPLSELEATELADAVTAAIATLSDHQRRVLTLRQSTDMTFAEIARAMGQPLNTVLSHMRYALQKIEREVRRHA
jgi:RNA polymerase sigma-70 factor (ECF subfamily)